MGLVSFDGAKLLVVGNDEATTGALQGILRERNLANLLAAQDPVEAMKLYIRHEPDLVILDLDLAEDSAFEVLHEVAARDVDGYAPVIVITSGADEAQRMQIMQAGARDLLVKPLEEIDVSIRVAHQLEERLRHKEMKRQRTALERFVNLTTRRMIRSRSDERPHETYRSILFADLRNFTTYSESQTPEEIFRLLNDVLGLQAQIIEENGGEVDKFIGDCAMGVFPNELSAFNAGREIIELSQEMLKRKGFPGLVPGVGIHSGDVVMGVVGSDILSSLTLIGDSVNIASRLCNIAKSGEIVMSASSIELLPPKIRRGFSQFRNSEVKGRKGTIRISSISPVSRHLSGPSTERMTIQLNNPKTKLRVRLDGELDQGFTPKGLE